MLGYITSCCSQANACCCVVVLMFKSKSLLSCFLFVVVLLKRDSAGYGGSTTLFRSKDIAIPCSSDASQDSGSELSLFFRGSFRYSRLV